MHQEQEESATDCYNENNMITGISGGGTTSGGDDPVNQSSPSPPAPPPAPKKRAETWGQEETRALISLRKETDFMFSTSKFNHHLWDYVCTKMRENGFDRSPAMCTDKWRNLLKQYKRVRQNKNLDADGSDKMNILSLYNDIDEIMMERSRNGEKG